MTNIYKRFDVRFLVAQCRNSEAVTVLARIARWNGVMIEKREIEQGVKELSNASEAEEALLKKATISRSPLDQMTKSLIVLNITPTEYLKSSYKNLFNCIVISYVWASISIIYFGMTIGLYFFIYLNIVI